MPDYENIARAAGWISAPCYNGGPDMVRNPEYALNYLQNGAWARDWRDACEQDELRALTDKSLAQETALKVWESHDIGSREPNQKHLSRSFTAEEKRAIVRALLADVSIPPHFVGVSP